MIEPSICGGSAALCEVTLTTCYFVYGLILHHVLCELQSNVLVYVRMLSGEAFVSQLSSVHSPSYFLPETGIAWLVLVTTFPILYCCHLLNGFRDIYIVSDKKDPNIFSKL